MTRFIRFDKFFTNSLIIITLTRAKMKQVKSFIDRLISVSTHAEREREPFAVSRAHEYFRDGRERKGERRKRESVARYTFIKASNAMMRSCTLWPSFMVVVFIIGAVRHGASTGSLLASV